MSTPEISNQELNDKIAVHEAALKPLYAMRDARRTTGLMPNDIEASIPHMGKTWNYDAMGLLVGGVEQGSFSRIDPVVDETCPTAVFLEKTGHYLSIPRPDLGERFPAYAERVSKQCGVNGKPTNIGALFISVSKHFARFGGYKEDGSNWPLVADYYFNRWAYLTDEERANYQAGLDSWRRPFDHMQGKN